MPIRRRMLWRGTLTGLSVAALLMLLWTLRLFVPVQLSLTNLYYVPQPVTDHITLIQLDDASLQVYGRSPVGWQRSIYADLMARLTDMGARVVVFDLIFSEPSEDDDVFVQAIRDARMSDARTRVVLVGAGIGVPSISPGDETFPHLGYMSGLLPVQPLRDVADYVAYVNAFPDVDGVVRRQLSHIQSSDGAYWSLPISAYLAYLRLPQSAVNQVVNYDASTLRIAERQLYVDEAGVWLQNYFGAPARVNQSTFRAYSLVDVLQGRVNEDDFADKIILVGLMNSLGVLDQYPVPSSFSGELMAGVEIQAHALETLLQGRVLSPLPDLLYATLILCFSVFSAWVYVRPMWQIKILLMLGFLLGVVITGVTLFNVAGLVMGLFHPLLAVSLPALFIIGQDISREIRRRQRSDFLLESVVAVSEQRLALTRILSLFEEDIISITPHLSGALWLVPIDSGQLTINQVRTWGDVPHEHKGLSALDLLTLQKVVTSGGFAYYPMRSQGRLLGVVSLYGQVTPKQENLLMDLTQRIAPTLEAAQLYSLTERQKSLLQTVLSQSPSPIIVLNPQGDVVLYNEKFKEIFSKPYETRFIVWLGSILDTRDWLEKIQQALASDMPFQQAIALGDKHYLLQGAPLHNQWQWILLFNDVTDLVELNHLKTRMIRMASHDLKNPLARVNGYVQLIDMNENLNEEDRGFLARIMEASNEMESLITDLLNLERLRSGHMHFERLDMVSLVQQIYWRHEPEAQIKRQTYQLVSSPVPLFVEGDFNQLSQVVSNLVNNAIKYTPEGGDITIRLMRRDSDKVVRLEVQDTGYGIPASSRQKLFTEFYRVRTSETSHIAGTGLGLSLVKSVIDAHKGVVDLISEEGQGSLFYVELALHTDQSRPVPDAYQ